MATARIVAAIPGVTRAQFEPERIATLRDARVRRLVGYAAVAVPHYRDLFAELGLDAREIRTAADLRLLPLLEKETVQRDPSRFRPDGPGPAEAVPFSTSGSSGTPLIVYHEPAALFRYLTLGVRERHPIRRLVGRRRFRTVTLSYAESTGESARAFYARATLLSQRRRRLPLDAAPEHIAKALVTARPHVMAGWGNQLEFLFSLLAAGEIQFPLPRLVRYFADAMSDEGRDLIERRFGVPVLSSYGSVETFRIGFFCEQRTGFHLHDDVCHVRVVDKAGMDCAPGVTGEVVVSNLVNRAMVLINHRLGDVAAFLTEPCACGRCLPLLGALRGRVSEIIRLPDGSLVYPTAVSVPLRIEGLLRFRLVQESEDRFRLEVVTINDPAYDRLVAALPELRLVLRGAQVEVDRRADLDEITGRKFRRVVALREELSRADPSETG